MPSEEAAAIFQERATLDMRAAGQALLSLGMALHQMNRFDEAITTNQEAATIFQAFHDPPQEGQALLNLGMALRQAHRFDEAIAAYKAAVADLPIHRR